MRVPPRGCRALALTAALLLLAAGCSPKTRPAKFYLLQPLSRTETPAAAPASPALIGLGPVEIPAYLDRPQIVTGGGGAQIQLDEFQRWAEPLRDNLTRVLAENLALLLPSSHVRPFPWNRAIVPDYQVEIQVLRFHVDAAGNGELKANWNILKQNKPIQMKSFQSMVPVDGNAPEAKVAAQGRALAEFSKAIAVELREFVERP